ncbi:ABC transporter permease [Bacillus gaemokensis]|uniref:ABC transporter permease n=1 Tax=Bacillus gaemokensis TaxID=574375 RepID=A0A073KES2_9BACI|nr:ABC transporter permease [Bacillus gaemokensis]KEK24986.1 ABC transporter permease [Bacillus gaemokensis]KYG32623.1 ABC transporter permease [Bacillus gaemokensis]
MFKSLLLYEFEKFWSKKMNIVCFIAIPLIVLLSLKFTLESNQLTKVMSPAFSSNLNFHITSLQEMLLSAFNAIVIIFCALSFHEEYRKGNLRSVFVRGISIGGLYVAKSVVVAVNIFLVLLLQLNVFILAGLVVLPKVQEAALFFKDGLYGMNEISLYSVKFYLLAYMSLLAFSSIVEFISLKCKSITSVIALSLGFLVASMLYVIVLGVYFGKGSSILVFQALSIPYVQFKGSASFAAGITNMFIYSSAILFMFFKLLSYRTFTSKDYLD